ncbi:Nuclease associated modular domain 3 [uncultured Caudovirales phage]|uniref:Nuclease associated modular domain 3 n=1 Tax=uncultured Caudovirales phage TaxID=2100421 RepID=A0A6J5PZU5_9CAUD|nr:Nuclease associated modular domain 3 [uncultured Caudovirales phage]
MIAYFYKTVNLINGKYYYGSGSKINYVGSGIFLRKAIKKYGINNFKTTILKEFKTREEAYIFENRFLSLYDLKNDINSYNMTNRGKGGNQINYSGEKGEQYKTISKNNITSWNKSEECRKIVSTRMKTKNPMDVDKYRKKSIDALSDWKKNNPHPLLGKNHSIESKQKMSATRKERNIPAYNKGLILDKTEKCIKCNRMFTIPGIKRHSKICKK